MIGGTEQVAIEERSLPRMSDGEDNDDLYDSDAPSEESERDEDSPQVSRVDICWLTNSDPAASTVGFLCHRFTGAHFHRGNEISRRRKHGRSTGDGTYQHSH